MWVNRPDIVVPLIESRDRIYTIVLVDDDPVEDSLIVNLKVLKQLAPTVPIVVSTSKNDPDLERKIRKSGIFYYHVTDSGIDDLKISVECALKKARMDNTFMRCSPRGGGGWLDSPICPDAPPAGE